MGTLLVQRSQFAKIWAHLAENEITVILGPRQSGKTTLVKQLKDELINKEVTTSDKVFYFNLDVLSDREIFSDQSVFIRFLKNRVVDGQKLYIFVDEAQRIPESGIFFKGVYDLNLPVKIILTGSSSLEIKAKIAEPLTGRKRLFTLFPLSFPEILGFYDPDLLKFQDSNDQYALEKIKNVFYKFCVTGGYPKVVLSLDSEKRADFLEEIFTSYLEKDVIGLAKIKDQYAFSKLVKIFSEEAGNLLNIEQTAQEINIKAETISKYLNVLEQTFVVKRIAPYFHSTRAEIRKMPKVYFIDTGLRGFTKDGRDFENTDFLQRQDKGQILENMVFSEIVKAGFKEINFWRTKDGSEVDFIINTSAGLIPVEIKSSELSDDNLTRSFSFFLDRYKPKLGYVVNLKQQSIRKIEDTEVRFVLPFQLVPQLLKITPVEF
ncbi:MAG: ATP-binding protein [bacterium]|nr:ATP-binding protein [bacterium]